MTEAAGPGARALILCHGEPPPEALLQRCVAEADLLICTDGAAAWALACGLALDVVLGDMDSLTCDCPGVQMVDAGPHEQQENSDAEKAILYALAQGARHITLLGATGKRLDHTLGNVWLAAKYCDRATIVISDPSGDLRVLRGRHQLEAEPGTAVSLLAMTPDCRVHTQGLQWPLNGSLELGTRGLSNRVADTPFVVDVRSGIVALIVLAEED